MKEKQEEKGLGKKPKGCGKELFEHPDYVELKAFCGDSCGYFCDKCKSKNHSPQTSVAGGKVVSPDVRSHTTNQVIPEDTPSVSLSTERSATVDSEGTSNLSECETHKTKDGFLWKKEKDVKEAIRKLKEAWNKYCDWQLKKGSGLQGFKKDWLYRDKFELEIDKLAGKELSK